MKTKFKYTKTLSKQSHLKFIALETTLNLKVFISSNLNNFKNQFPIQCYNLVRSVQALQAICW